MTKAAWATARCAKQPIIEGRKGYGCSDWKDGCQVCVMEASLWRTNHPGNGVSITAKWPNPERLRDQAE